jgi:hypothetical protein
MAPGDGAGVREADARLARTGRSVIRIIFDDVMKRTRRPEGVRSSAPIVIDAQPVIQPFIAKRFPAGRR